MTKISNSDFQASKTPLRKVFFLAVQNLPDWYQIVPSLEDNEPPPKNALLETNESLGNFKFFQASDREVFVWHGIAKSKAIRRLVAEKIALKLVECQDLATKVQKIMLQRERNFLKDDLKPSVQRRLRSHHASNGKDMLGDLEFLRTLNKNDFVHSHTIQTFDNDAEVLEAAFQVLRSKNPVDYKMALIAELLSEYMFPQSLIRLGRIANINYGGPEKDTTELHSLDQRYSFDISYALMKHWKDTSNFDDKIIRQSIVLNNEREVLFFIRREYVENNIPTHRVS